MGSKKKVEIIPKSFFDPKDVPDDDDLQKLYMWVDGIPLSRPKRNLARDFSDGVMTAELIQHFIPKLIDLHNYAASNSSNQKESNWFHLNKKVFVKLKFELNSQVFRELAQCRQWVAEKFLMLLREKIDIYMAQTQTYGLPVASEDLDAVALLDQPEVDQHHQGFNIKQQSIKKIPPAFQPTAQDQAMYNPSWQNDQDFHGRRNTQNMQMVPLHELETKERIFHERTETIEILNKKIQKLEQLASVKDLRIDDLSAKLEELNRNALGKPTRFQGNQMRNLKR